jgi:hypothetical protein
MPALVSPSASMCEARRTRSACSRRSAQRAARSSSSGTGPAAVAIGAWLLVPGFKVGARSGNHFSARVSRKRRRNIRSPRPIRSRDSLRALAPCGHGSLRSPFPLTEALPPVEPRYARSRASVVRLPVSASPFESARGHTPPQPTHSVAHSVRSLVRPSRVRRGPEAAPATARRFTCSTGDSHRNPAPLVD